MAGILLPGEEVCDLEGFIRGHGTSLVDSKIKSLYFGTVKQINKLITVEPKFIFSYSPEIGDVVIGRVSQICNKKWKLEMNSKFETYLSLSAINLPGVMQRRKSEEDEMNMRTFFDINDLIVCEVQKVNKSGTAALHTRNDKYRKLEKGILVSIRPYLIAPIKTKFLRNEHIEVIAGCNGYVWISVLTDLKESFMKASKIYKILTELSNTENMIQIDKIVETI